MVGDLIIRGLSGLVCECGNPAHSILFAEYPDDEPDGDFCAECQKRFLGVADDELAREHAEVWGRSQRPSPPTA